jgi:hypothetical protein
MKSLMTKRDYFVFGSFAALALWTWHLSSELSATSLRLDATMEDLKQLEIDLWDNHHLGGRDPDPLDLFREDKKDDKKQDPLGLAYLENHK